LKKLGDGLMALFGYPRWVIMSRTPARKHQRQSRRL
jgi:hypothetical protein